MDLVQLESLKYHYDAISNLLADARMQAIPYDFKPVSFYNIKLITASKKLNISEAKILKIFEDAGFNFQNKNNIWLSDSHLSVLESYYSSSLKKLFKSFKKKIIRSEGFDLEEVAAFFRNYVKDSEFKSDLELFECRLDDYLLKKEFYFTLFSNSEDLVNDREYFHFILRGLKFKILRIYKDLRTIIFSTLILNHYHIFTDEEDGSRKHFNMKAFLNFN